MAKEKKLQTTILNFLRGLGKECKCFKIMKCSDVGIPDIFFTTKETGGVLVEVKAPGETPEPHQEDVHHSLRIAGTRVLVVDSWGQFISEFNLLRSMLSNRPS